MLSLANASNWQIPRPCGKQEILSASSITEANVDWSGEARKRVTHVSSLRAAGLDDLAFCSYEGTKGIDAITNSNAGIILCKKSLGGLVSAKENQLIVFLDNPRLTFVQFVNRETRNSAKRLRITSSASVSRGAVLGVNCQIGDYVTIGEGCIIGNNVIIEQGATIHHAVIGDGCVIQAGVAIGCDGFAYERHPDGHLERFPHLGGVRIGKNVEICANSSIARGALEDTIIGDNTKLDALVHVAHNVSIGENCQLAAGTIIGGSTKIGNSCWTGLNSTLKHHITVGNNVLVAAGACVIGDVADCEVVAGVPAKSIKDKVRTEELYLMTGKTHA